MKITEFTVSRLFHERFATISHDVNKIHVDARYARNAGFDSDVVHGVHVVLIVLESIAESIGSSGCTPTKLGFVFKKPVFPGDRLRMECDGEFWPGRVKVSVFVDLLLCCEVSLELTEDRFDDLSGFASEGSAKGEIRSSPLRQAIESISEGGDFPARVDFSGVVGAFPKTFGLIGYDRLASLVLASTVVGMYWPGEYSFFAGADFDIGNTQSSRVRWKPVLTDSRFGITFLDYRGSGLSGRIRAFFRPEPVVQPSYGLIRSKISNTSFCSQNALIVGGSKGLGEVFAKCVLAGGGEAIATYSNDVASAKRLQSTMKEEGGDLKVARLNVCEDGCLEGLLNPQINVVYFMATPRIFRRKTRAYEGVWFKEFYDVYCAGLVRILDAVVEQGGKVVVFLPSSVAVDEKTSGLEEYRYAKLISENILEEYSRAYPDLIDPVIARLPRLETEQTNSIIRAESGDTLETVQGVIDRVNQLLIY